MPASPPSTQPRFPIRAVAERTGLSPDVLRAWERRYGVVIPGRSEAGQRLYSEADIVRLRLLVEATASGHPVGRIAALPLEDLRGLVERDGPRTVGSAGTAPEYRHRAFAAVRDLDTDRLQGVLRSGLLSLGTAAFLDELVTPLLHEIGAAWHDGKLGIAHEHAASAVVRSVLGWIVDTHDVRPHAPRLVVACLAHEQHELGAMLAAATAAQSGWRVIYLGANVPADQIVAAATVHGASLVAISVVRVPEIDRARADLDTIRGGLPAGCTVVTGGAGAAALGVLTPGIVRVADLTELRLLLLSHAAA